jgi:hypothetical protein
MSQQTASHNNSEHTAFLVLFLRTLKNLSEEASETSPLSLTISVLLKNTTRSGQAKPSHWEHFLPPKQMKNAPVRRL